jgi:hypothetical protein
LDFDMTDAIARPRVLGCVYNVQPRPGFEMNFAFAKQMLNGKCAIDPAANRSQRVRDKAPPASAILTAMRRFPPPWTIEDSLLVQVAHWRIFERVWFGFFHGRTRIL